MKIPILSGIFADGSPDFRSSYPRNFIPVPKASGINDGYLRPADGIVKQGDGPGKTRCGINWNGVLYRVMGSRLCKIAEDGTVTDLGNVGDNGKPATMDYSFDRLAIASAGSMYYYNGTTLSRVTDADLGTVIDLRWIGGYFMTTDGRNLVTTDLADPASINPLHYGSAESDPDPIMAVGELRNEAYAFGRYTIEVYTNVSGTGFPFQRISGAQVVKGPIGTHAYTPLGDTFIFLGSGRGEAPAVYQMVPGNVQKVSTREIDRIFLDYTEAELSGAVLETRVDRSHQLEFVHLPDRCLVYDTMGSQAVGQSVWFSLDSGLASPARYRARDVVWCYDRWCVADPGSTAFGYYTDAVSTHYGDSVGWEVIPQLLYNDGNSGILHDLELVTLPGRVALGADPVVWSSYTHDGDKWSQPRSVKAGKQGETLKRLCWRNQGQIRHWRAQKFWGTSDAHIALCRLEAQVEPLKVKG